MKNVARLYQGFQPAHYELFLDPDLTTRKMHGQVTITGLKRGRPSQRLTFHQNGLKVTSAVITKHDKKGDTDIPVTRINNQNKLDEVRLHATQLLYAGNYTVTMHFEGKIRPSLNGVYTSDYKVDGKDKLMLSTQFESHFARTAFPCIDEPEAKATFQLTLVTPIGETVLSNTPIQNQRKVTSLQSPVSNGARPATGDQRLVTQFENTPKMSTYLVAFAFGELQHKAQKTKSGVEVGIWATKAQPAAALDFALEVGVKSLEFFEDYYQTPYPLPKLDHLAVPNFSSAAMENWGLIIYREMAMLADPDTTSQSSRELIAEVICHETSHQWFGNLVTMRWWDDLWLNESFANVMAYEAIDHIYPEWHTWNTFVAEEGLASIRRDSIAGVQAIKTAVHHPDEINSIFDPSIVYAKGGRLINLLSHYLGRKNFRAGLKAYFAKHSYGNTTGNDLWEALGKTSNKDIVGFMRPWLEQSGFPIMSVNQIGKDLEITQHHFLLDKSKTDENRIWPVPLLSDSPALPEVLDSRSLQKQLPSKDFVRLDQDAAGHYVVRYTNPEHGSVIADLAERKVLNDAERLMLLNDSSMISRAGWQSFESTLQLLEHYGSEHSEPVWGMMSLIIADARRFVDLDLKLEDAIKARLRQLIAAQYERLGWDEKPREGVHDTKLRATILGLGVYSEEPTIVSKALELFKKSKHDTKALSGELRGVVYGAAIRHQAHDAFEYLVHLSETTQNADLKDDITSALCAAKHKNEITTLLSRIQDESKVKQHDVSRWMAYLLRNRYARDQAWGWLRDNWNWVEKTFKTDMHYDYFPRYAAGAFNTPKLRDEFIAFFKPKRDQTALTLAVDIGIEELTNRVEWLQRDLPAVQAYFPKAL